MNRLNSSNEIFGNNRGFSLPEIMVAIAMMGSLAYFGITTTFDVVSDMKKETQIVKIGSDLRAQMSRIISDSQFKSSQSHLDKCMNKNNEEARANCFSNNQTIVDPQNTRSLAKLVPDSIYKKQYKNLGQIKGTDGQFFTKDFEPCDVGKAGCRIRAVASAQSFCDWKPGTGTSCGSTAADHTRMKIKYQYLDTTGKNKKIKNLFEITTVISNQSKARLVNATMRACPNDKYVVGLGADMSLRCSTHTKEEIELALAGMAPQGLVGPMGLKGDDGKIGLKGYPGKSTYCHHKGGGVELSLSQRNALNRLQGPARIINGNRSTVKVVNKAGRKYTMANSSVVSWANRGGGCFAEGTTITMADGTKKPIEQIAKGDLVWNPLTGKASKVAKGVKGPEKYKLYSFAIKGEELSVTKTHPMLTQRGIIKAEDVRVDDLMMWKSGELLAIESIRTHHTAKDVYNLHLVSKSGSNIEGAVIANGVITGDLEMQQELQNKPKETALVH